MPAGAQILLFGPASDSRTQVEIPLQIKARKLGSKTISRSVKIDAELVLDSCSLTIYSTTQTPARSSNYEVWQALSALMSVCARQDKGGSVAGLGKFWPALQRYGKSVLMGCRRGRQHLRYVETNCCCTWDRSIGICFAADCQMRDCGVKTGTECGFDRRWQLGSKKKKRGDLRKDF